MLYKKVSSSLKNWVPLSPHFPNYLYDALSLYVTGLNMVLEEGGDPKDGKALVEKLLSRSYHSAMGYRSGFTTNLASRISA